MIELAIKKSGLAKLREGLPYLLKEDFFEQLPKAGTSILIVDSQKTYYGYIGKGHKADIAIISQPFDSSYFQTRINLALKKRLTDFSPLPEAYRLIHNEADAIPGLTIEIFQLFAVVTYYNQGIIKFEQDIIAALTETTKLEGVYAKYRLPGEERPLQVIWGKAAPEQLVVTESTGKYIVKLNDGLMNGLFLDQRANRIWLAQNALNKDICNTFSYTGALSIACATGNAKSTCSVDLSAPYSHWCEENIQLNHFDAHKHTTIVSDTLGHFEYCRRNQIKYDQIILDPPTFAKKKGGSFSVAVNYQDLISASLPLLRIHGELVCSTNYSQWTASEFQALIPSTAKKYGYTLQCIYTASADKDFPIHPHWPESDHLKFAVFQLQ